MDNPTTPTSEDRQETYLQKMKGVQMGIAPRNLEEGLRLAQLLSKSTLVPKEFQNNPGNVIIAIQMGMEIGLPPMQALQSIAVINGRPSLWGDGLLAVVRSSPLCEYVKEPPIADGIATCLVKRRGEDEVVRTFSVEQAKKANLWGKAGPWQQYPERMLQMRARAFALRDVFPDVLRGLAIAEEQLDVLAEEEAAKPSPETTLQRDLGATDAQFLEILTAWNELKIPAALRIVQAKRFAGEPQKLMDTLAEQGATVTPKAIQAPKKRRGRPHKQPDPVATAVAEVEARPSQADERTDCLHGVDIKEPCEQCQAEARLDAALDAEAAQQTRIGQPPDDDNLF